MTEDGVPLGWDEALRPLSLLAPDPGHCVRPNPPPQLPPAIAQIGPPIRNGEPISFPRPAPQGSTPITGDADRRSRRPQVTLETPAGDLTQCSRFDRPRQRLRRCPGRAARREVGGGIDHRRARARRRQGRERRCEGGRRAAGFCLGVGLRIQETRAIKAQEVEAHADNRGGLPIDELNVNTHRTDPLSGKAGHARRRSGA